MTDFRGALRLSFVFSLTAAILFAGCRGRSSELSEAEVEEAIAAFDYEKGVAGFEAPTLEELDANNEWTDKPVVSPMAKLKEEMANYKPPISEEEALKLKGDSPENLEKILGALQIQPESEDDVDWDATWVHHVGGDINSVNPFKMSSTADFDVVGLTGVGVIDVDIDMNPLGNGDVLKSWQASQDNKIHKFVLRDDLVWSDGTPITAADFEFSFKVLKHPEMITEIPAVASGLDTVAYCKAYDDQTFVVFHTEATAVNDMKSGFPVLPSHIYRNTIAVDPSMLDSNIHLKLEDNPVVGGPYKVVRRERGKSVVLERREDYYMHNGKQVREKPYFKTIRIEVIVDSNTALLALMSGRIDDMVIPAPKWNTDANTPEFYANNVKVSASQWGEYHITWNCESPLFEDVRVRRAMSHAIDYDELLDRTLDGLFEQANGPFHPESWMAPNPALPMFDLDLDKARQLLDEAGWKDTDADGIRDKVVDGKKRNFEFTILRTPSPVGEKVVRVIVNSLNRLGLKVNERQTEFTVLQQQAKDHTFDAMFGGWGSGADPYTLKNIFETGENRNYGQYSNKEVDELFKKGMVELDREKRAKIYQELAKILHEDQPYTWLFYPSELHGFNKKMRGYQFSARGPFHYSPGMSSVWKAKSL